MTAGIKDFLIITTERDVDQYSYLLGNGNRWGIRIDYKVQPKPAGLPQAFILGQDWLEDHACAMMLGDNILYGHDLGRELASVTVPSRVADTMPAILRNFGGHAFVHQVSESNRYGVVRFDEDNNVKEIVEKPENSNHEWVAIGLYVFDHTAAQRAAELKPSARGELEIVDMLNSYREESKLSVTRLGRGFAWFDAGNPVSLLEASQYVHAIQSRQGQQIACLEEIALRQGWISKNAVMAESQMYPNEYGNYLRRLCE